MGGVSALVILSPPPTTLLLLLLLKNFRFYGVVFFCGFMGVSVAVMILYFGISLYYEVKSWYCADVMGLIVYTVTHHSYMI